MKSKVVSVGDLYFEFDNGENTMANRHNKKRNARTPLKEFVTVAFAEDVDLAKHYKKLLSDDDIPAIIRTQSESSSSYPGIAVMVPEDHLDEAHVLIESQGTYNDFYEMAFQDEDEEDVHDDFDDDFDDEL
jgi:hypothetical protein